MGPTKPSRAAKDAPKTKAVKGRREKLAKLVDMPLDIFFEISGHLHPKDLLHLTWTSKAFHQILARSSSKWLWKQARCNIENLPECPSYLTEPQYARLFFDPHCHYCGTSGVQVVLWVYRRRACKACLDQHFNDFRSLTLPSLPCWVEWDEILPKVRRERYCRPNLCPSDEVDLVFQHIEALRDDEDGLAWFILQRTTFMAEVSLHASRCEKYQTDLAAQRTQERSEMRSRRVDVIRNRLVDMGFEQDIIALEQSNPRALRRHRLVWQTKELTDKNWNDIKPSLAVWLTDLRKPRIQKERLARVIRRQATIVQMLREYVLSLPPTEIIPGPADLCFTKEISGLINHPDETVFSNSIPALRLRLPQFASYWRQWIDGRLLSILPSVPKSRTDATDMRPLHLATTLFECTGPTACHEILPYPRILAHKCMTQQSREYFDTDERPIPESIRLLGCEPFNFDGNKIKFHADASGVANTLVGLCRWDPDEATAVAMDELNSRFACSACGSGEEAFVFSWRVAVSRDCQLYPLNSSFSPRCTTPSPFMALTTQPLGFA
ncbi:hypothetical protein JAAARDRAFT_637497 [Jaapia argillacea MUCL 33604]|uniref:F-box domain-containing protein n=1 Tax=Jaapia argillacea MUCL 33604 TaxID=933084 RepID=A0A067PYS7_9AGAM|nr:hypothetical protein JAAARDRAFT_637497 [Jaapia argillacea MUCL 33604]